MVVLIRAADSDGVGALGSVFSASSLLVNSASYDG